MTVNLQDIMKLQIMSNMTHHTAAMSSLNPITMIYQFFIMLLISMMEDIRKALPKWCDNVKHVFGSRMKDKVESSLTGLKAHDQLKDISISLTTRHNINSVVLSRKYDVEQTNSNNTSQTSSNQRTDEADSIVDAVIAYISKLHNIPMLKLINNGHFIISYRDKPIQIAHNVYVKIDSIDVADTGMISFIKFTITSNVLSASELAAFVKKVHHDYLQDMKNALGTNIFFFDQKMREGMNPPGIPLGTNDPEVIRNHKAMVISSAPKSLNFTMTPFYSNKTFKNIFGKEVRDIEHRVKFFMENKDWYDSKGIPYQLGIMLSGIPGAGKTSVIRAIANYTRRHIINVNFSNITTATQLKHLFFSDRVNVFTDGSLSNSQGYFIPIDQRLYVLEEIDAIGDIVRQRTEHRDTHQPINDELTLAEILTVLDGTMEVPGRIIVMTSNHPEVLDRALVRPGRIDLQVKFGNAPRELIKEMYEAYLDKVFPNDMMSFLPHERLSPAEVSQVLFRHFNASSDVQDIIKDLHTTSSALKEVSKEKQQKSTCIKNVNALTALTATKDLTGLNGLNGLKGLNGLNGLMGLHGPNGTNVSPKTWTCVESAGIEDKPMFKGLEGLTPDVKITEDGIISFDPVGFASEYAMI